MIRFHGCCEGCTQQEVYGIDFCIQCRYFDGGPGLPNLSNAPLSESEIEKIRLKKKHNLI
jgi:hypothetical protein